MSIIYQNTNSTPIYLNTSLTKVYYQSTMVWESFVPQTITFNAGTSLQSWVVPSGTTKLIVDCVASRGANTSSSGNTHGTTGGNGGRVQCNLSVSGGQTLYFTVGTIPSSYYTASYNASDIRTNNTGITNTTSLNSRLVVAGGGGSAALAQYNTVNPGGAGGGTTGAKGSNASNWGEGGYGGTQTEGGARGYIWQGAYGRYGNAGTFGLGGNGQAYSDFYSGAGGAGWYGGGSGGGSQYYAYIDNGSGGGGSSYTNSTYCTNVTHIQGYRNGAGYITITTSNT